MKRALLVIVFILCELPAMAQALQPATIQPVTASAGADVAFQIPDKTRRLTVHPRLNVYMKTASGGPGFYLASGTYFTLESDSMALRYLYFEAASGSGNVELFAETP